MDERYMKHPQYVICPKKGGGRVCEYMHAEAIYTALTQGRTVQKGGSNPNLPEKSRPEQPHSMERRWLRPFVPRLGQQSSRK